MSKINLALGHLCPSKQFTIGLFSSIALYSITRTCNYLISKFPENDKIETKASENVQAFLASYSNFVSIDAISVLLLLLTMTGVFSFIFPTALEALKNTVDSIRYAFGFFTGAWVLMEFTSFFTMLDIEEWMEVLLDPEDRSTARTGLLLLLAAPVLFFIVDRILFVFDSKFEHRIKELQESDRKLEHCDDVRETPSYLYAIILFPAVVVISLYFIIYVYTPPS